MEGSPSMHKLFAVCAPGVEPMMARELNQLGLSVCSPPSLSGSSLNDQDPGEEAGGVEFEGSLGDIYRANLHLRTAGRVLVRLGAFYAAVFPELRRKAGRLVWEGFLSPGQSVALRVTCHGSRLYHERAVAERVIGAIADRLGQPPSVNKLNENDDRDASQLIVVRLKDDYCMVSVDSSGPLLHRRGYRLATAKAPLRETLAAAMLLASRWNSASPLLDPFCGSGTLPIEATLLAKRIPPGRGRRFAFMDWPNFDEGMWKALFKEAAGAETLSSPRIIASDRDLGAIRAAKANAKRAGVADCIDFTCRSISAIEPPPPPGWVVTNPPYGIRVSARKDLRNLYAQIGHVLRDKCPGWNVALLCSSTQLLCHTGLVFDEGLPLMNGGLKVRLVMGRVQGLAGT